MAKGIQEFGNKRRVSRNMITFDFLYKRLRKLVSDKFQIRINDGDKYGKVDVIIVAKSDEYCWTHFRSKTIKDALQRAINKLENPNQDYIADDGEVWKANESSIYDSEHIQRFLRTKNE